MSTDEPKVWACPHCDEEEDDRDAMQEHGLVMHVEWSPFKCGICQQTFELESNVERHHRINHPGGVYDCVARLNRIKTLELDKFMLAVDRLNNDEEEPRGTSPLMEDDNRTNTMEDHKVEIQSITGSTKSRSITSFFRRLTPPSSKTSVTSESPMLDLEFKPHNLIIPSPPPCVTDDDMATALGALRVDDPRRPETSRRTRTPSASPAPSWRTNSLRRKRLVSNDSDEYRPPSVESEISIIALRIRKRGVSRSPSMTPGRPPPKHRVVRSPSPTPDSPAPPAERGRSPGRKRRDSARSTSSKSSSAPTSNKRKRITSRHSSTSSIRSNNARKRAATKRKEIAKAPDYRGFTQGNEALALAVNCSMCNPPERHEYSPKNLFANHMMDDHVPYICTKCPPTHGNLYTGRKRMMRHLKTKHQIRAELDEVEQHVDVDPKEENAFDALMEKALKQFPLEMWTLDDKQLVIRQKCSYGEPCSTKSPIKLDAVHLWEHLIVEHHGKKDMVECNKCSERMSNREAFEEHVKKCHKNDKNITATYHDIGRRNESEGGWDQFEHIKEDLEKAFLGMTREKGQQGKGDCFLVGPSVVYKI